jgi:threonine dehydratase
VARAGDIAFTQGRPLVDQFVLVDEARIAQAILRLLELEKLVVEGAGAVPLAAMLQGGLGLEGKRVALVIAGGNIDVSVIARVIERGLAADGRLCRVTCRISDRPGGLARVVDAVAKCGASIKEVHHDRSFGPADVAMVGVNLVLETRDRAHIEQVRAAIRAAGIDLLVEASP